MDGFFLAVIDTRLHSMMPGFSVKVSYPNIIEGNVKAQ
jgi:hypothetical protein